METLDVVSQRAEFRVPGDEPAELRIGGTHPVRVGVRRGEKLADLRRHLPARRQHTQTMTVVELERRSG